MRTRMDSRPKSPRFPQRDIGWTTFAERALRNIGARHSSLMSAARITLPHFSVSSAISLPKSVGEPGSPVPPRSAIRALIFGSASASFISLFNLAAISGGVFLRAPMPTQWLASKPGCHDPGRSDGGSTGRAGRHSGP